MPRNIFLLEEKIDLEDRLTFAWSWMLNLLPQLGQAFCDLIARQSGLPQSTFQSATDHPTYQVSDYPDMLLTTKHWQVLFEHKLDAPMDTDQLTRYLRLADNIGARLAFMARDVSTIADQVLESPVYLKPAARDHFVWTDIYPLVASCSSHAATDFEQYLARLGLRPEDWGGIGDPFVAARPQVMKVMMDASNLLRRQGWPARTPDAKKWDAIEIPKPLPNIHLGYLKLKKTMGRAEPRVIGRAVEMIIWTMSDGTQRYLPRLTGQLANTDMTVYVRPDWKNRSMPSQYKGELYFTAPMRDVLGTSYGAALDGIANFANTVLNFVRDGGEVVTD